MGKNRPYYAINSQPNNNPDSTIVANSPNFYDDLLVIKQKEETIEWINQDF